MKRKRISGALFSIVVLVLAIGSWSLDRRARVEAAGEQAPRFEVDPMWPKPLAQSLGDRFGHRRERRMRAIISGSFTAKGELEEKEKYLHLEAACRGMLHARAARFSNSMKPAT